MHIGGTEFEEDCRIPPERGPRMESSRVEGGPWMDDSRMEGGPRMEASGVE